MFYQRTITVSTEIKNTDHHLQMTTSVTETIQHGNQRKTMDWMQWLPLVELTIQILSWLIPIT